MDGIIDGTAAVLLFLAQEIQLRAVVCGTKQTNIWPPSHALGTAACTAAAAAAAAVQRNKMLK